MLNNTKEQAFISFFYKLLQCLHHLNLMQTQLDGKDTKAFLKNWHILMISFHIDQINMMWL
jgi:hypothetical protein